MGAAAREKIEIHFFPFRLHARSRRVVLRGNFERNARVRQLDGSWIADLKVFGNIFVKSFDV